MFTFHPSQMALRIPGQVPHLDPELDRTFEMPPVYSLPAAVERGEPRAPIFRAQAVATDLGLHPTVERTLTSLVKTLSQGSTNEVDFRRGLMTHLIGERYDGALRRAVLARALSFYRSMHVSTTSQIATQVARESRLPNARVDGRYHVAQAKSPKLAKAPASEPLERGAARGGKYHRRVPVASANATGKTAYKYVYDEASYQRMPGAHIEGAQAKDEYLRGAVARILDKAGEGGCEPDAFAPLVQKHGAKAIAGVLASVGAASVNGRICRSVAKSKSKSYVSAHVACFGIEYEEALWKAAAFGLLPIPADLSKAEPEQLPAGGAAGVAAPGGTSGGGAPSPKKLPPGTRRIWHNRVVERGVDDKWHVVGHVAGLEDPGKVQALAPHEIDPEHLKDLITKIKALLGHEQKKQDLIHAPIPSASNAKPEEQAPKAKTQDAKAARQDAKAKGQT